MNFACDCGILMAIIATLIGGTGFGYYKESFDVDFSVTINGVHNCADQCA